MRFHRIQLQVAYLAAAGEFFADVLSLPARPGEGSLDIAAGTGRLILREERSPAPVGVHHLAFDIPASTFATHRAWLADRVPLLAAADGTDQFEGPPGWNSSSVYFAGPDRMVLELIARRNRPEPPTATPPQILSVSEVGVAVADVPGAVARLHEAYGLPTFGPTSAEFAPVGDEEGLLILVEAGRAWLPVFDVVAAPLPLDVEVSGIRPGVPVRLNAQATIGTRRVTGDSLTG